jgi:hypothetical protein
VAAVVLLQLDLVRHTELAHEVGHVAHPRAAEGIDALVVVAHRQTRSRWDETATNRRRRTATRVGKTGEAS